MGATPFKTQSFREYQSYLESIAADNSASHNMLIKNLRRALLEELTERQQLMIKMYYIDEIKMADIAKILNVNVSTVSRTINRGLKSLQRCLRYGAKELLREDLRN